MAEAHDEGPVDTGDVRAMAEPEADALACRCLDGRLDAVERFRPGDRPPAVLSTPAIPHQRPGQPQPVVWDLGGGAAADAEKATAVGIVGVAPDAEHAPLVRHVDQHPAEGRVAIHGAHGANGAGRHGGDSTSPLPRARGFCYCGTARTHYEGGEAHEEVPADGAGPDARPTQCPVGDGPSDHPSPRRRVRRALSRGARRTEAPRTDS